jgi:hypothetical protein
MQCACHLIGNRSSRASRVNQHTRKKTSPFFSWKLGGTQEGGRPGRLNSRKSWRICDTFHINIKGLLTIRHPLLGRFHFSTFTSKHHGLLKQTTELLTPVRKNCTTLFNLNHIDIGSITKRINTSIFETGRTNSNGNFQNINIQIFYDSTFSIFFLSQNLLSSSLSYVKKKKHDQLLFHRNRYCCKNWF